MQAGQKRRTTWGWVVLGIGGAVAILAFLADLGGARDTLCGSGLQQQCIAAGLASEDVMVRHRTISLIQGRWGLSDRDCGETVEFAITTRGGETFIESRGRDHADTQEVIAVDGGVVFSRSIRGAGPREQWEFRPNGDRLLLTDKNGVTTTLARCAI